MRALPLAALFVIGGCTPYRVEPAVGSSLKYSFCGSALPSDVRVFVRNAPCPDLAKVQARAATIEARYGVLLGGTKVHITGAAVECEGVQAFGCTAGHRGDDITISHSVYVFGLLSHELAHVAVNRTGGGEIQHFDIDHPEARNHGGLKRRTLDPANTLILGSDE